MGFVEGEHQAAGAFSPTAAVTAAPTAPAREGADFSGAAFLAEVFAPDFFAALAGLLVLVDFGASAG